jgi:DNA-binding NarL/FixJ family response regulator
MTNQGNGFNVPKKVMVIDDHILFREGLISLFQSTPDFVIVGEAGSVQTGIENARLLLPDIILMDFSLPDGTGLDATRVILAENPACKIVFLTVYEADDVLFAAIRAGAKGYFTKNVRLQELLSSLHALERGEVVFSRKMTSRIVEELSHTDMKTTVSKEAFAKLTPRELDVLAAIQTGATNFEIAQQMVLSENTVKHHVQAILEKLGAENRHQASLIAFQMGLIKKIPTLK